MQTFSPSALKRICSLAGASKCSPKEVVQSLWSGYGRIQKVDLTFEETDRSQSAIVKFVDAGGAGEAHPRGWNGGASHSRKIRSYEVERNFLTNVAWPNYWEPTRTLRQLSLIG